MIERFVAAALHQRGFVLPAERQDIIANFAPLVRRYADRRSLLRHAHGARRIERVDRITRVACEREGCAEQDEARRCPRPCV